MKLLLLKPAIVVIACYGSFAGAADLDTQMDSLSADTALVDAQIGIDIYDLTTDSSIYCRECTKLFTPASNMKLFTSAAALQLLGPSYRFKTGFFVSGKIDKKGRLLGNLMIVGGGDPLISGRFRNSVTDVLQLWADSLISEGIREIKGDIVIDNSFFTGSEFGAGWSLDDLSYWYACPISALSFNDNCVDLKFLPGEKVGDPAVIILNPPTDYIKITNDAITVPADSHFTLDYFRVPFTNDVEFFGGISISDTLGEIDYVSVHRPDIYCAYVFGGVLNNKKIKFTGNIRELEKNSEETESRNKYTPLFTWNSDSMAVVISVIDKNSQNFFAEQTLKTIGKELGGEGNFRNGLKIVVAFLDSAGISGDDISMHDGSGLSHYNMVKPEAIIKLFRYMNRSPDFKTYYESLAIPGVDRSVKKRLENIEFRERVRSKTGSIANALTFSGYIDCPRTGHLLAFSIMVNKYNCDSDYVLNWFDTVVGRLLSVY